MKFARYLQDTQIPEWKKAYIDYRRLKKQITLIRKMQQKPRLDQPIKEVQEDLSFKNDSVPHPPGGPPTSSVSRRSTITTSPTKRLQISLHSPDDTLDTDRGGTLDESARNGEIPGRGSSLGRSMSVLKKRRASQTPAGMPRPLGPCVALPLHELITQLSPEEKIFFIMLDRELDKIESFYLAREKETQERSNVLRGQLNELNQHKKIVQAAHPKTSGVWYGKLLAKAKPKFEINRAMARRPACIALQDMKRTGSPIDQLASECPGMENGGIRNEDEDEARQHTGTSERLSSDPEDYRHAKKVLKKALLEHYRELKALHNYRILNITGFRKSLKKFEKLTKVPAQKYMTERIDKSAFSSNRTVSTMMEEVQNLYVTVFARGNRKRAMRRLHAGILVKSHHYSTFRSGVFIGLSLPAFVIGVYQSFQQTTRDAMPGWDGLLFVYGVLLIPVLFSLLIGINLLVWSRSHINYVFIFELDTRSRLDYRQYYEIPSILLTGLFYAFWLSFQRVGAPTVSPTVWPLVWLGFAFITMINPLPWFFKPSRYWLFRRVWKLLIAGARRVEFTDFWLGDQFCSLIFSLSNIYVFVCVYANGFDPSWRNCAASSPNWPVQFVLAALPLTIRLVQSIRRYFDSKLITHLINGGKYGSGVVSYLFYYIWRHQGGRGSIFALWCLFGTVYSTYASSWDILMDWSVMRPRARYPFLRDELIYSNYIPLYYIAIVLNVIIRFSWVFYIPQNGPDFMLRTFIAALLEVFRRWQWNFYRLENEHLGNVDQYRATREVPLPYSLEDSYPKDHSEDEDDSDIPRIS